MKQRPIIFNSDEVRAILDGRKTMMRRVIKPQFAELVEAHDTGIAFVARGKNKWPVLAPESYVDCPYGVPGDRLWVKETHIAYEQYHVYYFADSLDHSRDKEYGVTWTSPVRMPRWASRIMLEIISIRVERLQDISEEDALAEGIRRISHGMDGDYFHFSQIEADPKNWCFPDDAFRELWDSVNAKLGYRWDANPWVWVIEFKREEG